MADALKEVTITINVHTPKIVSLRMWLGLRLMRLAGLVLPCKVEIKDAD